MSNSNVVIHFECPECGWLIRSNAVTTLESKKSFPAGQVNCGACDKPVKLPVVHVNFGADAPKGGES